MASSLVLRTGGRRSLILPRSLTCNAHWVVTAVRDDFANSPLLGTSSAPRSFSHYAASTRHHSLRSFATQEVIEEEEEEESLSSFSNSSQEVIEYEPISVIEDLHKAARFQPGRKWDPAFVRQAVERYERHLAYLWNHLQGNDQQLEAFLSADQIEATRELTSSETTERAIKAVTKCKIITYELSAKVRELERLIGSLGMTPLTDELSFRLLEANGKAGNVGRALSLLQLRASRQYKAKPREFELCVQAIESAGLYMRKNRNVFMGDSFQPAIDNPTRWLDAILINMHERGVQLSTHLANRMLHTYASTGKSGKALHFFYQVVRDPMDPTQLPEADQDLVRSMPKYRSRRIRVKMKLRPPPPFHKVPSQAKGLVTDENRRISKLERESQLDWSIPLTAAFSFADSLSHGACGHEPIHLDVSSWNILIKACCYRGSLWRGMHILQHTMPRHGIVPNTYTYNTLLAGLARVGDTTTQRELLLEMTNKSIRIDAFTVQGVVDGMLNVGDVAGAITFVQDAFNQHSVLPPYTTHLKIFEFCLATELLHEAKRHLYFIQQLWKWQPLPHHDDEFVRIMELTKKNPKLSKTSLIKLFAFFGERLDDSDFI